MKKFWLDTIERAIKTAAQAAIAVIGTSSLLGDINWGIVGSTVAVAALLSLLTSIASNGITGNNSASLIDGKPKK